MAKEQALQFILRVNEDAALRDKLKAVSTEGVAGLVKVGKELGFDFTIEEFQAVAVGQWEVNHDEIPEDELAKISGGEKIGPDHIVPKHIAGVKY